MMHKTTIEEMQRPTLEEYKEKQKIPLVLIADNIRSMNNIGSLFRTADTFSLEAIYLIGISKTPPHPDIHKTALGAEDSVDWFYSSQAISVIEEYKKKGYQIVLLEQCNKSVPLQDFAKKYSLDTKILLVLGNEVHGVHEDILPYADIALEIPQLGTKHSLNVSVAAGIAIWEIVRTRI